VRPERRGSGAGAAGAARVRVLAGAAAAVRVARVLDGPAAARGGMVGVVGGCCVVVTARF
jgi:hypothetical protein